MKHGGPHFFNTRSRFNKNCAQPTSTQNKAKESKHTSEEDVLLAQGLVDRTRGLGPGGAADTAGVAEHGVDVLTPMRGDGAHDHAQHVDEAQDHFLVKGSVRADRPISAKRKRYEERERKKCEEKRTKGLKGEKITAAKEATKIAATLSPLSILQLVQPQKIAHNAKTQHDAPGSNSRIVPVEITDDDHVEPRSVDAVTVAHSAVVRRRGLDETIHLVREGSVHPRLALLTCKSKGKWKGISMIKIIIK